MEEMPYFGCLYSYMISHFFWKNLPLSHLLKISERLLSQGTRVASSVSFLTSWGCDNTLRTLSHWFEDIPPKLVSAAVTSVNARFEITSSFEPRFLLLLPAGYLSAFITDCTASMNFFTIFYHEAFVTGEYFAMQQHRTAKQEWSRQSSCCRIVFWFYMLTAVN